MSFPTWLGGAPHDDSRLVCVIQPPVPTPSDQWVADQT